MAKKENFETSGWNILLYVYKLIPESLFFFFAWQTKSITVAVFISLSVPTGCSVTILLCYSFTLIHQRHLEEGSSLAWLQAFISPIFIGSFMTSFKACWMPRTYQLWSNSCSCYCRWKTAIKAISCLLTFFCSGQKKLAASIWKYFHLGRRYRVRFPQL